METSVQFYFQANSYIILLVLCYRFIIRKQQHVKLSRVFLITGLSAALLLPLVKLNFPLFENSSSPVQQLLNEVLVTQNSFQQEKGFSPFNYLFVIYLSGATFISIQFYINILKLVLLKKSATKKEDYYLLPNSIKAFSFLNLIFIGNDIPENQREMILNHERIHRSKKHSYDIIFSKLLEILFWFNPFVHQLKFFFSEVHEFEADSFVEKERTEYIDLLLQQHLNQHQLSIIHQFNSNHLKNRIMRINNNNPHSIKYSSLALSIGIFMLCFSLNQQLFSQQEKQDRTIYDVSKTKELDKEASFPGGEKAMLNFLMEHVKYPKALINKEINETIFIEFTIREDGTVNNYKVLRGGHPALEETAINAIKKMPKWIPAEKDNRQVASTMILPFKFVPTPPAPPKPPKAPKYPEAPESNE